jgi:hypothetical protein
MVAVKAIPETYTALSVETIKAAAVKRVDWGMVWCKIIYSKCKIDVLVQIIYSKCKIDVLGEL